MIARRPAFRFIIQEGVSLSIETLEAVNQFMTWQRCHFAFNIRRTATRRVRYFYTMLRGAQFSGRASAYIAPRSFSGIRQLGCCLLSPLLAACALNIEPPTIPPAPPNYRELASEYFENLPAAKDIFKGALISPLQEAMAPQPGAWYVCVQLANGSIYVVFYGIEGVQDMRPQVAIDRCPPMNQRLVVGAQ